MRAMAATAVLAGIAVLALVWAATMLSVTFATRGAMATNRPIVEVLHLVGATTSFIAGNSSGISSCSACKGGAIGGGAAILLFALLEVAGTGSPERRRGEKSRPVRQSFDRRSWLHLAISLQIVLIAW